MLTPKDIDMYRRIVEEAVAALGRDDVGVNVEDGGDGMLAVTFSRGAHTHAARIPLDAMQDHGRARIAVNGALLTLSKEIAQEALIKASQ